MDSSLIHVFHFSEVIHRPRTIDAYSHHAQNASRFTHKNKLNAREHARQSKFRLLHPEEA
jgi:hypothetical protein